MAITQHQRLGGLNNAHVFVTILDTGKSKIKALADLASGEDKRVLVLLTVSSQGGRGKEALVYKGTKSHL